MFRCTPDPFQFHAVKTADLIEPTRANTAWCMECEFNCTPDPYQFHAVKTADLIEPTGANTAWCMEYEFICTPDPYQFHAVKTGKELRALTRQRLHLHTSNQGNGI
jgi:phage-related protein